MSLIHPTNQDRYRPLVICHGSGTPPGEQQRQWFNDHSHSQYHNQDFGRSKSSPDSQYPIPIFNSPKTCQNAPKFKDPISVWLHHFTPKFYGCLWEIRKPPMQRISLPNIFNCVSQETGLLPLQLTDSHISQAFRGVFWQDMLQIKQAYNGPALLPSYWSNFSWTSH